MRARLPVVMVLTGVLVAGCAASTDPLRESGRTRRAPYSGPLFLPAPAGQDGSWTGAAGAVVQCSTPAAGGSSPSPYREGSVGRSADGALDGARNVLDTRHLHAERREKTRVLYTTVYGGKALRALVVRHGPAAPGTGADDHGLGWYPESWAACNLSDFPERVSAAEHVEVWHDATGRRIDTHRVVSYGSDGCLGAASLNLGARLFVRAPLPGLEKYFLEPYRRALPLPADAVDTGWSRGRRHLWLSRTRHQAYVGAQSAPVEAWPELTSAVGCG